MADSVQNTLHIAVCDDDKQLLNWMNATINKLILREENEFGGRFSVSVYDAPDLLLSAKIEKIDILFLDVEMPGMDGFHVAEIINKAKTDIKIIFLTHHKEQVQRGFKAKAYRYLYKPVKEDDIAEALNDAVKELTDREGLVIADRNSGHNVFVKFRDIHYVESMGNYSIVFAGDEVHVTSKTLRFWKSQLDKRFYQCHKSYIINLGDIQRMADRQVVLNGVHTVPVSARSQNDLKKVFHQYVKENARFE